MSDPVPKAITEPLTPQKSLLRVVFCGSVDDGKSTLIGRLLADTGNIADDQLAALEADSRRFGTTGGALDYALLVDGLEAEREQAITIDVAYRYASSKTRAYIIADTPGHVQYTRNMATGASQADVAVVLIDARLGLLEQTRRHVTIAALFGVREVIAAVNKMDLIGFSEADYAKIAAQFRDLATRLGIGTVATIPLVARDGDGVARVSTRMPWYVGPTLLAYLDSVSTIDRPQTSQLIKTSQLRLPVQLVNRPNADFRGYCGTIAAGTARVGDAIVVLPSGQTSTIAMINTVDGERLSAAAGDAVTLVLKDAIDVSRGDVIVATASPPAVVDQFAADVVWMGEEPMLPGRQYLFKCGTRSVTGSVSSLRHVLNIDQLGKQAARRLAFNEIGHCHVALNGPAVVEPYDVNRSLGSFIIIDKTTRFTVGAGMIRHTLRRATNVHPQSVDIDRAARAAALGQVPRCIWFTGLSGAGKSTIANALEKRMHAEGRHTYLLDGDNVRLGLNRDLGFTNADRVENIRRVGEVAKLMVDAGLIVLVAFISPFRAERQMVRDLFAPGDFIEVFVDTPLDVCEARDAKGLYAKARAGDLKNFTGIDSPYEVPLTPEVRLAAGGDVSIDALLTHIVQAMVAKTAKA